MNLRIALCQTKPVTGDLEGNVSQILSMIDKAKRDCADILVFPETAITGYCCGALFEQEDFVQYNKRVLEEVIAPAVPDDMVAVVGFVDIKGRKKNHHLDITNSAAIIQAGKVQAVYDKVLLANDNHHEDKKYFTPGKDARVYDVTIKGKKVRIVTPICEDAWGYDHDRDIVNEMKENGAELILCPNQSYFYYGKQELRHFLFSSQAKDKGIPVVAVNAAGVGDIVKNIMIYDGGSMAYTNDGKLAAELNRFSEDYKVISIDVGEGRDKTALNVTATKTAANDTTAAHSIKPGEWGKYEEIYDALVFEQQELFKAIGIPNVQVHLSGGVDSAVVAAIARDAMGPDHSVFITNPTNENSQETRRYAQHIADSLGVKLYWNPTQKPFESVVEAHRQGFGKEPTDIGKGCIQAVLRTVQGIGAYHTFKSGISAAGNHTEIVLGWSTFHDIGSIGVHSPIGDLTKMEVFDLARYINRRHGQEVIPAQLYDGRLKPAAELFDAKEDPIDYFVMSGVCAEMIRNRKGVDDLVRAYREKTLTPEFFPGDYHGRSIYEHCTEQEFTSQVLDAHRKASRSVFKAAQAAPIVIISPRSRGFSNRETIINHYKGWCDIEGFKSKMEEKDARS